MEELILAALALCFLKLFCHLSVLCLMLLSVLGHHFLFVCYRALKVMSHILSSALALWSCVRCKALKSRSRRNSKYCTTFGKSLLSDSSPLHHLDQRNARSIIVKRRLNDIFKLKKIDFSWKPQCTFHISSFICRISSFHTEDIHRFYCSQRLQMHKP